MHIINAIERILKVKIISSSKMFLEEEEGEMIIRLSGWLVRAAGNNIKFNWPDIAFCFFDPFFYHCDHRKSPKN